MTEPLLLRVYQIPPAAFSRFLKVSSSGLKSLKTLEILNKIAALNFFWWLKFFSKGILYSLHS